MTAPLAPRRGAGVTANKGERGAPCRLARRLLAQAYGFTEVENYPWLDDDWNAELKYVPGESLRLRNPVHISRLTGDWTL